jgi:hypothetical protein
MITPVYSKGSGKNNIQKGRNTYRQSDKTTGAMYKTTDKSEIPHSVFTAFLYIRNYMRLIYQRTALIMYG